MKMMSKTGNPYLITWKAGNEWHGKAIVIANTPIEAWERFILKCNTEFINGDADLTTNEIDRFSVEVAADEFIND
jgi:hypothetical protein